MMPDFPGPRRRHRLRRAVRFDAVARAGRHGDGVRRRRGYGYLTGSTPALKMVGQTSMRIVTDYTFGVIPMFLLMGAIVTRSGMSRELFQAANRFVGPLARRPRHRHDRRLRRLRGDQRILGGDGGDILHRGVSGNATLQLSAIVRHRRDRGGRNAWERCSLRRSFWRCTD